MQLLIKKELIVFDDIFFVKIIQLNVFEGNSGFVIMYYDYISHE